MKRYTGFLRNCANVLPEIGSKIIERGLVRKERAHAKDTAGIALRKALQVACA